MSESPVSTKARFLDWLLAWAPDARRFSNGLFPAGALWAALLATSVLLYTNYSMPRLAVAIVSTFAAAAVGALIGFLFGVPKSQSGDTSTVRSEDGPFRPNTNLEQVSDWVTKIIVGIGLVQFREIGTFVHNLGQAVGDSVRDPSTPPGSATVFAVALLAGSALISFLLTYMWTTTRLYDVFVRGNVHR